MKVNGKKEKDDQVKILHKYMKLKEQLNEQLSSRNSRTNLNNQTSENLKSKGENMISKDIKIAKADTFQSQKMQRYIKGVKNDIRTSSGFNSVAG